MTSKEKKERPLTLIVIGLIALYVAAKLISYLYGR